MILVPLLVAAGIGYVVRPTARAVTVVSALVAVLAGVLWIAAAADDGETAAFVAALAGLELACTLSAAAGSAIATRRDQRRAAEPGPSSAPGS